MAAIVCHGLQSRLESQLAESRIHRLRLPSPTPLTPQPIDLAFKTCFWEPNTKPHCEENSHKTDTLHHNQGGWSFLQALSNVSQGPRDKETTTYVHPQVKQSSLRLSPKSLELCTENLGNETGTDIIESGIDMLSSSRDCVGTREPGQFLGAKKTKTKIFPPPLTTIRGSESLQVRPHREDGRLVIEVTKVPSISGSCFQAERSHGRLRLCVLKNPTPSFDPGEDGDDNDGFEEELESEMNGHRQDVDEEETEEEAEEEGIEDGERDTCRYEGTESNSWSVGGGSGMRSMEKYEWGSRRWCKEGGDHETYELLIYWEKPLRVAIS